MRILNSILCTSSLLLIARNIQPTFALSSRLSTSEMDASNQSPGNYVSGSSSVAFVTTPDENAAKKLARGLVDQKLAACVNIIPNMQSVYIWEGKVNEDNEILLVIKTRTSRVEELIKYVKDNHPYSVPEVITLPIDKGHIPYMDWIAHAVSDKEL